MIAKFFILSLFLHFSVASPPVIFGREDGKYLHT